MEFCIHKYKSILCAAAAVLLLSGCGITKAPEFPREDPTEIITLPTAAAVQATETEDPRESVEYLTVTMEAGELYQLDGYPNLKAVDLSGSTCYAQILEFMKNHSQLDVTYSVDMGGTYVSSRAASVILEPGKFQYEQLMENLQYLPDLKTISLPNVQLDPTQIGALVDAYPEITLDYTVELFGNTYDQNTTYMDLSYMGSAQVEEAIGRLGLLVNLTEVNLSSDLSMEDVARLQDAAPRITFHYSFELFGKSLSTTTESVEYKNQAIGNDGEAQIRRALAILDNCDRFVLDNCKLDYDVLDKIREDFRDGPKVVWRVYFGVDGRYNQLTDDEMLRAVYNVTDSTCGPMRYCEGVKYMDIGHNEYLTDLSFVAYMKDIEVLIASEAAVKSLEGFENCKKLTWLELAYCYKLENIDALEGCESLRFLNISYSKVTSYASLDSLPLERFVALSPRASTAEQNTFVTIHPGCRTAYYGYSNPWTPWRYDDNGKTFNAYYKEVVRKAFNYDYLEQFLPKDTKKK